MQLDFAIQELPTSTQFIKIGQTYNVNFDSLYKLWHHISYTYMILI